MAGGWLMQVSTHVYRFSGPLGSGIMGANVYLLVGDGLTLVDTGFRGRAGGVLSEIRRLGYSPSDVERIIVTHHHADHAGSLAVLKAATGASVFAHAADAPFIDGKRPQPGPSRPQWLGRAAAPLRGLWSTAPAVVDAIVDEGDELSEACGARVLHTPGHTPGSICLFLAQEGVVIVGDVLVHRFGLRLPTPLFTVDIPLEIESVGRLEGLDFDVMCFGHGRPIVRNARAIVSRYADGLERKRR